MKDLLGVPFRAVQEKINNNFFSYSVVDDGGIPMIEIKRHGEKTLISPEKITSLILSKLKEQAETLLNRKVAQAVITVPVYFTSHQRKVTKNAAIMAGFEKIYLINEATASVLSYLNSTSMRNNTVKRVMVFHMGQGTFNVSVAKVMNGQVQVLAAEGDRNLGGSRITAELVRFFRQDMENKNIIVNSRNLKRLKKACERLKCRLSSSIYYYVCMDEFNHRVDYENHLYRPQFERITKHVFDTALNFTKSCLRSSRTESEDIDVVLMTGGSSVIPAARHTLLTNLFSDHQIERGLRNHCMVHGAAIYGKYLGSAPAENLFKDVLAIPIGRATATNRMLHIFEKNTQLPAVVVKTYSTQEDSQTAMECLLYQGDDEVASMNDLIGVVTLRNLTDARKGDVLVDFTFSLNEYGMLSVKAIERDTNNSVFLDIEVDNDDEDDGNGED